jgi:hypothetical protein
MPRKGHVPTKEELKASIMEIAESCYDGLYAPGLNTWDTLRPKGWARARTMTRRFGQGVRTPDWATVVFALVGLKIAPPNSRIQDIEPDSSEPFTRLDDSVFCEGIACSRAYSVPTEHGTYEVHYVLR